LIGHPSGAIRDVLTGGEASDRIPGDRLRGVRGRYAPGIGKISRPAETLR
jgi:hypothetical protein